LATATATATALNVMASVPDASTTSVPTCVIPAFSAA
jgi:hypothetical protein